MAKIQSLLQQAAVIRDATAEKENTALRIGSMFVSFIQAVMATMPPEVIDATGINYSASSSNFIITFKTLDEDGASSKKQIIIPSVSTENAGLITPEKLKEINNAVSDITMALEKASRAEATASDANSKSSSANNTATEARAMAANAQGSANIAIERSDDAVSRVAALETSVGRSNGLTPLGDDAKIPSKYLPGYVDDVIDFNAMVSGVALKSASIDKSSKDPGCMVVYDQDNDRLLLAVSNVTVKEGSNWDSIRRPLKVQNLISPQIVGGETTQLVISDYWQIDGSSLNLKVSLFSYYNNWNDADSFGTASDTGRIPVEGKIYICTSDKKTFRWGGEELVIIGSDLALGHTVGTAFPGDEGDQLREDVDHLQVVTDDIIDELNIKADVSDLDRVETRSESIGILPIDGILKTPYTLPPSGVWFLSDNNYFNIISSVQGFVGEDYNTFVPIPDQPGLNKLQARQDRIFRLNNDLYRFDGKALVQVGGASIGNNYNATVNLPLPTGEYYYDIKAATIPENGHNVLEAVYNAGKALIGMQITYAIKAGSWKTFQYIGVNTEPNNFKSPANWLDNAAMSAGSESVINVNNLCGDRSVGYYDLASAIQAVIDKETETGIIFRKAGIIFTYSVAEGKWETKQLVQRVTDFANVNAWTDFGGKTQEIVTSDTPAENGKDAFSTGGAFDHIATDLRIDTETPGTIKVAMVNAKGDVVGDEHQFAVGTGSGSSGATVAIALANNPVYGRVGGKFIVKAAIMSVVKVGSQETYNSIMEVNFINRATKNVVASFQPRQASSSSLSMPSFEFDLSTLGTSAGEVPLSMQVVDDAGNSGSKSLSLYPVDVTIAPVRKHIGYDAAQLLKAGGMANNIPLYAFPNNASPFGIKTKIEMYKGGEWVELASPTISDTFTHVVNINPAELSHGAYPIRIQGTDVSSGVRGNVLHTSVMVIEDGNNTPIVGARWVEDEAATNKLFESVIMDVACYKADESIPTVEIKAVNQTQSRTSVIGRRNIQRVETYTVNHRLVGYSDGDTVIFKAVCGNVAQTEGFDVAISGSLIDIETTEGAYFDLDFSNRSNSDVDKSISAVCSDGSTVSITVNGANYSSNGFVKDSFGTENYNQDNDTGRMSLRVAEDVTATSTIRPFANTKAADGTESNIELNGRAITITTQIRNVADRGAALIECRGARLGFVLTGESLTVYTNGSLTDQATTAIVPYSANTEHRFDIVIEPSRIAPYSGIGVIKVYKDGEEAGAVSYTAGALPTNESVVEWDGHHADIYTYEMTMWNNYYTFIQAFNNYLIGKRDTNEMLAEYEKNNVMASQTGDGVLKIRPSMAGCLDAGLAVVALCKSPDTEDIPQNYPDYLEGLDGDKKTTISLNWYVRFPGREWQSFIVEEDPTSNQGTTSSWRKIKNKKAKHKKAKSMRLLYTREEISQMYNGNPEVLAKYDLAAKMIAKGKIQVREGGNFTDITTLKVDYSDSCGAHNGAMMQLMNETQMALGENYLTPAQIYNEGDFPIHNSIDSVPCALFRTDHHMTALDATKPENAYFHAKANFNVDKGDPSFFGFEGVKGYNADCLNYGDFTELVAAANQKLADFKRQVLADSSTLVPGNIYVLSEYCGPDHVVLENDGTGSMQETTAVSSPVDTELTLAAVQAASASDFDWGTVYLTSDGKYVQYKGGTWTDTTGTMSFDSSTRKWKVIGRVVNPVENYELLKYDYLDWMQGVNSITDMMVIDETTGAPIWMSYYESRYPDDDDLNELYESGKKCPYRLYKWLKWCQQCNHNLTEADGNITINGTTVSGTKANRLKKFERELHKEAHVRSLLSYTVASDYKATVDQRAKNAMIGFYLDTDGEVRMYLSHWYDGDCVDGSDNDCGLTIPWDMDARTSHLYQGWDSVMFQQTYAATSFWLNSNGSETITLQQVAGAMRTAKYGNIVPFSPDGCYQYWITERIARWAKVVSSYDGERKYIENSTQASNYFYALHGLRLDDLPDYQRKRFKFCDGQYQVGDLYVNPFAARMMGTIEIGITAAQDGFFGLGEDRADTCADSCQLKAGESYTLQARAAQESGKMIYVFGADNLAKLDVSKCTLKLAGFNIANCTLLEELIMGGENYEAAYNTGILTSLNLGAMPFLRKIDVRNTDIVSVSAKSCPRLKELLADGSALNSFAPAEASPLETVTAPDTLANIELINLKKIAYTGLGASKGLQVSTLAALESLRVESSPLINIRQMMLDIIATQSTNRPLSSLRVTGMSLKGDGSELLAVIDRGVGGLNSVGGRTAKPVIEGRYKLGRILESAEISRIEEGIEGITIEIVVEAYINAIDEFNGEYYSGIVEVGIVTLDNIGDHLQYYNGETAEEYVQRMAEANKSIHDIITQ